MPIVTFPHMSELSSFSKICCRSSSGNRRRSRHQSALSPRTESELAGNDDSFSCYHPTLLPSFPHSTSIYLLLTYTFMSLLVLSAADVEKATASMSPDELQILMASVFRTLSRGDRWLSSTPHRTSISMPWHTALFMPARIATDASTGTTVKVVSVPSSPGDTRGLPGSTLVLDEDTGAVKAIVNSRSLTALRNAAGKYLCNSFQA